MLSSFPLHRIFKGQQCDFIWKFSAYYASKINAIPHGKSYHLLIYLLKHSQTRRMTEDLRVYNTWLMIGFQPLQIDLLGFIQILISPQFFSQKYAPQSVGAKIDMLDTNCCSRDRRLRNLAIRQYLQKKSYCKANQ